MEKRTDSSMKKKSKQTLARVACHSVIVGKKRDNIFRCKVEKSENCRFS